MMTAPERALDLWRTLQLQGVHGDSSVPTIPFDLDVGHGPVRLARAEDGNPRLLVPIGELREVDESLSGAGIEVGTTRLVAGGSARVFLQVVCRDCQLAEVFLALVDDVIRRLQAGLGPGRAVASAIAEHRDLLRRGAGPSLEFLAGLFGELSVLEQLQQRADTAARAWTGPLRQRHDFSGECCAEVKSILARDGYLVEISSLDQLQAPVDGRSLYLISMHLERSGNGGRSVRDLINSVRSATADIATIDRALEALDLGNWHELEALKTERFQVSRQSIYEVSTGFPRIVPDSFVSGAPPFGILGITYKLDLRHAEAFRLDAEAHERVLAKLARQP